MKKKRMQLPRFAILAGIMLAAWMARGDIVPSIVNYQGKLLGNTGQPATNGSYVVAFRIWDHSTDTDTSHLLWGRQYPVYVVSGMFSVLLGEGGQAVTPNPRYFNIADAFADSPNAYLGLTIVSDPGGAVPSPTEIVPRQRMASAPYAFTAANAEGLIAPVDINANGGKAASLRFLKDGIPKAQFAVDQNDNVVFWAGGDSANYGWISPGGLTIPHELQFRQTGPSNENGRAYLKYSEAADGSSSLKLAIENDTNDSLELATARGPIMIRNHFESGAESDQNITLFSVDDIKIDSSDDVWLTPGANLKATAGQDISLTAGGKIQLNGKVEKIDFLHPNAAGAGDGASIAVDDDGDGASTLRIANGGGAAADISVQAVGDVRIAAGGALSVSGSVVRVLGQLQALPTIATVGASVPWYEADTDGFFMIHAYDCDYRLEMITDGANLDFQNFCGRAGADTQWGTFPMAKGDRIKVSIMAQGEQGQAKIDLWWRPFGRTTGGIHSH